MFLWLRDFVEIECLWGRSKITKNSKLPSLVVTAWPSSFSRQLQLLASPQHLCTLGTSGSVQNATKLPLASSTQGNAALLAHTR